MHKDKIKSTLIIPRLKDEHLIGFCQTITRIPVHWLIEKILDVRVCYLSITDKGIHLQWMSFFGHPSNYSFYQYDVISNISIGHKGILQCKITITLKDGKTFNLIAQTTGLDRVPLFTDEMRVYLQSKYL